MINISKKLYWSKYRPTKIEGMILLPRIKQQILTKDDKVDLSQNLLFAGSPGTGKTSLASVIAPKGALKVNASYNSSVEDLKDTVIEYCKTGDIFGDNTIDGLKIVWLDEFDGVSAKYQEALRGFIEEFADRVRFIATCNNLSKISPAMQSRFNVVKFDPENEEETQYLKDEYLERAELIAEKNSLEVNQEQLKTIINMSFPDLRSVLNTLQNIEKTGGYAKASDGSLNSDLYNIVFGEIKTEKTYAWVMENYGDKVENLIKICGRPLCQYIFDHKPALSPKVPKVTKIVKNHSNELLTCIDPFVLAVNMIYELQEALK